MTIWISSFIAQVIVYIVYKFGNFGQLTPEITRVRNAPFWTSWQKVAYPTEYPSNYCTNHHCIITTVRRRQVAPIKNNPVKNSLSQLL